MRKTFYLEYKDQFGATDELEVEVEIEVKDLYEYDRRGKDYKVGEEYRFGEVVKISETHLQLTDDDKKEIEGEMSLKVDKLNSY
jgi:hypothetical protein